MGTDIHGRIELRRKNDPSHKWWPFVELGLEATPRNYDWFCALAGLRCGHEPECPKPVWADRGLPTPWGPHAGNPGEHSFSWVSLPELRQAVDYYGANNPGAPPPSPWPHLADLMQAIEAEGNETRLVFGFDS